MTSHLTSPTLRRSFAALIAATFVLAACGGSDEGAAVTPADEPAAEQPTVDASGGGELDQGDVGEVLTDALGEDEKAALDDGIAALSPETRYGIVAGQLDPEPSVEVDDTDIRLVFDGSSLDAAFTDCIIAKVIREEGETVTVVYPDGEEEC